MGMGMGRPCERLDFYFFIFSLVAAVSIKLFTLLLDLWLFFLSFFLFFFRS